MKKKFISLLAAVLITLSALFSGCSCAGEETLSFSIDAQKAETLTYAVNYAENYLGGNGKSNTITDQTVTFTYTAGSFKTRLEPVYDLTGITSDIKDDAAVDNTVFKYSTEFEITLTVTVGDKETTHKEWINTTAFIANAGASLAPLYATEDAEYMQVYASGTTARTSIIRKYTETLYNKADFTVKTQYKTFEPDAAEITLDGATETETKGNYAFRTAIDNAELLLALRAIKIDEKSSKNIPVVSPAYSTATALAVKNDATASGKFTVNGTEKDYTYNTYNFKLANANTTGTSQFVKVEVTDTANPLLLEYAKPLTYYGSFESMGWLVFTLTSAE